MPSRAYRTLNTDAELARAEQLGFDCGVERMASDAVAHLAAALIRVATPIWRWGDGHGGGVFMMIVDAAHAAGMDCPDHYSPMTTRVSALARRDGWKCTYCAHPLGWGDDIVRHPQVDHVIPRSQGGSNALGNLALSCAECNNAKGGRTPEQWAADRAAKEAWGAF